MLPHFSHLSVDQREFHTDRILNRVPDDLKPPVLTPKAQAEIQAGIDKLMQSIEKEKKDKEYAERVKNSKAFQPGAFVIAQIAREVYVAASVDAVNLDGNGGVRYNITTQDGIEVVNIHASRISVQPAYSAETFSEGFVFDNETGTVHFKA